jgi:hypothetical protein
VENPEKIYLISHGFPTDRPTPPKIFQLPPIAQASITTRVPPRAKALIHHFNPISTIRKSTEKPAIVALKLSTSQQKQVIEL